MNAPSGTEGQIEKPGAAGDVWAILSYGLPILFACLLFVEALLSLAWRIEHDTPLLHYAAFLIDRFGLVPYRDVFETSMPGTLIFHLAIGRLLGYGDLAFRAVDLALLAVLLAVSCGILRVFGWRAALLGSSLFGCFYLGTGQPGALQRDYLAVIPIAAAVLLALEGCGGALAALKSGLLIGLAACIKPQLAIGALVIWPLQLRRRRSSGAGPFQLLGLMLIGACLPPALCLAWLWSAGGLEAFIAMISEYLPLHLGLSGGHEVISSVERPAYLLRHYLIFGEKFLWLLPGFFAFLWISRAPEIPAEAKSRARALALLALAYSLAPVLAGQFWQYHWMPCFYFLMLICAFSAYDFRGTRVPLRSLHPIVFLALVASMDLAVPPDLKRQLMGQPPHSPEGGRADELAAYISRETSPQDTVQVLDWAGGSIHALLISGRRLATPFLYDYHFYHHVDDPYVQWLRHRFVEELEKAKPKLIIDVIRGKGVVSGPGSSASFPELRAFIKGGYELAQDGDGYLIYRRIDRSPEGGRSG